MLNKNETPKDDVENSVKTRRQKEKKLLNTAFAYELPYSTTTICACSAAMTAVGTAICEDVIL